MPLIKQGEISTMIMKVSFILVLLSIFSSITFIANTIDDQNDHNNDLTLSTSEFSTDLSFDTIPSSRNSYSNKKSKCASESNKGEIGDAVSSAKPAKLHLNCGPVRYGNELKTHVLDSTIKDLVRIQNLHRKIIEKKDKENLKKQKKQHDEAFIASLESPKDEFSGKITATLKSGASLGSGEYFIDVFLGTPPKHVWLILDTGSDLNWIQCVPCYDCFEQNGPHYDPEDSTSYKNISCHDPYCQLASSPDRCEFENQTCPYFYEYADGSNTTGDFAIEKFTLNLTGPNGNGKFEKVVDANVMFGCGHWNKGFFHGASGILGLGRGPLSFSSQIKSIFGHSFSYCLTDLFSNTSVSSKLIFGEDKDLLNNPNLNFTSLINEKESPDDTFYYLMIKSIMVGGEILEIPEQIWNWSSQGSDFGFGGTIIDSGSTLTFFPESAYDVIREAFKKKIKLDEIVEDDFVMDLCYNVSAYKQVELPEFGIHFADGAVWNFPAENYFYPYQPNEVICLALLKTPHHSPLTIIGNLMQQNFHIFYDTKNFRLGYSPTKCAEI